MPKVTVIIPVFNGEPYIRNTLNSVFNQTYHDYEIVIVDDGSNDASLVILNKYGDRIQLIQQVNSGQAGARNAGIKRARGKYVAFLDQDDVWYPTKLERQVALLEADPKAVMVHCDMDWIDENGNIIQQNVICSTRMSPQKGLTMTQLFGWDPCIYPSTMLIRRSVIDQVGGFDPEIPCFGEDIDLMLRLKEIGHFLFLEEAGVQYRKHSTNFSASGTDAMFNSAEKFFQKLKTRNVQDKVRTSLLNKFLAQIYSDWGKTKLQSDSKDEAQRLLLRSLKYYPWNFKTYGRLVRTMMPKF